MPCSPPRGYYQRRMPSELSPGRRRGLLIVTFAFSFFTLNAWGQVFSSFVGWSDEPGLLLVLQTLSGAAAYATALGTWRRLPWAPVAAVSYGMITGGLILSLGPILDLPAEARTSLPVGALSVVLIGAGVALYLRSAIAGPR